MPIRSQARLRAIAEKRLKARVRSLNGPQFHALGRKKKKRK